MTIDEAIAKAEYIADCRERCAEHTVTKKAKESISESAAESRQLAEWLKELKDLREENKVLTSEYDRLNKLKEKSVLDICRREARLREAKRLLKSAIDEWHIVCEWGNCGEYCGWYVNGQCSQKWSGEAEALKLIGETNEP